MFKRKLSPITLAVSAALALGSGLAQAAATSFMTGNGPNVIEDDSNEYVFRPAGDGFELVVDGDIAEGDVLLQILDFPIINGVNIDSSSNELSGVALNIVDNIVDVGPVDPDGGGPLLPYDGVDFDMVAGTAGDWLTLTGIDITALPFDETGLIALLFDDEANNLDVFTQGLGTSLPNATDGDLVAALALTDADDFIAVNDVPKDIGVFAPGDPGEVPGVTIYGNFSYELSFSYEDFPGNLLSDMGGSGNNLVTDRLEIAAVIDDTQASWVAATIPEPSTVALVGLGLLGAAGWRRKKA